MAATVSIFADKGATPSAVDVVSTGIKFRTDDNPDTIDNTNPIPIPSAGTKRSFWVHLYLKVTGGTFTDISNVKFYTAGGTLYGDAGVTLYVGTETPTKNSGSNAGYTQATGTVGDSGSEMVVGHAVVTAKANANIFVVGSPKAITISEAGNIINAVNETSNYVVLQLDVANTATAGTKTAETLTFRYDET